jgi:hypothetical protein
MKPPQPRSFSPGAARLLPVGRASPGAVWQEVNGTKINLEVPCPGSKRSEGKCPTCGDAQRIVDGEGSWLSKKLERGGNLEACPDRVREDHPPALAHWDVRIRDVVLAPLPANPRSGLVSTAPKNNTASSARSADTTHTCRFAVLDVLWESLDGDRQQFVSWLERAFREPGKYRAGEC